MPYYRLKSGKLINVPENLLEDFKSSEQFEGAVLVEEEVKPVKTEAVATEDASVTAMDSASENGSSEPLSNEQASFNYEQRTGNKPGSIMDLTDDDYIEKGPMGETLRKKNSSGVVITDYEKIKKTLKKTPEAKQKLIKLATNYAAEGLEGDVFDTWEDASQYIDDQSDKFDEEAKAEKEQIYKFDDNFKLKDKAIEQLRKDTGNTSNTFDTPFSQGLFKQGLQATTGNWFNDARTDVPSQVIELEDSLEGAIAGGEDVRTLQKLAQGKMNLQDKEALINKYRIPKILEVRKELVKEYDALKLETEDVFGDLKRQESSLVKGMNLIKNNKPATGYTQETVDEYNGLLEQYNSLKDTFKQTSDRYKGKQESLNKSQEVINAQWGVDIARMALKSNFKLTDDVKKYTEAFSGDGVFNWAVDQVGGTAQEMVKLAGQTVVGFPVFVTTAFGDLFTDDDTYSSFDSMRDTWGDLLNFNVVPDSKDEKFNITDGEGNLKEFSARAWSKTAFNMIPFTAEIIRNVKQGKFTGYREGLGKMLSNYTKAGAVTKSAQNMKNLIISSDAAFRMTILNNSIEANKKGLSGPAGDLYATTVSFTEGLVQAIMPDYKFIKGGAGKEIKNALFNSLKGLTTKESTKAAVKTYTGNMFKELLEEEVTFGMNIITDMAFSLGALKQNEFVDEQINLIAGTFMLSGGMGLAGVKNTYNAQKAQIYKDIFNNLKSTDLYFKTMLETATDPSLIEDIDKARVFVRDVASVMNTAPEDVSSDQIELLIQKKKLIEKKKNTDSSFHGPINDRIKEIDSEIENSSIKRSITERFDKDVSNFAKSLNSIGQKVDETKIFEDDQDGSADDKMEEFLISVGESKEYAKESKDSYGTFVVNVDGKEILVVNKASALSDRVVTTGQHEFLHKFLKSSLSSKPELVQQAGELLLKEILASSSSSSNIVARIESYATDDKITADKFFEEILPLFSEAVTNKEVKLNESSITKIQDFFRRIFQDLGLRNIRFDKAEGVINFIKDYNKAYSKGNFKGSLKALAGKDGDGKVSGVSLSKSVSELNTELEDLIDREFEMDEGDFDAQKSNLELKIRQAKKPSVKKESSTKEKSAPKKVYDNEGLIETIKSKDPKITGKEKALAEADLTESFDALALKAIKYDTRKGDYDRNEIKDYLREFFPRVVESFDPSKSKFSTWVTNNMAPKAQQTYEKFRKIADKSLDVEAGGVGSVKEMSGDVNTLYGSDSKPSDLKDSTQKMIKATSFGPISDPSILEAVENVIDIKEGDRPNFKSLNNKFFDKVSEAIFGISGKKARGNATLKYDKSGGSSEANSLQNVFKNDSDVRKFIKTMPDYNIATKETVVNEQGETIDVSRDTYGRSIGINPKVLAIFYDKVDGAIPGISSPNGRSLGKTTQTDVYKLKSEFTGNISPSSVAKLQSLIGINKGTLSIPIKGEARTEFGSILTGLTKMYIDNVINTVGRSKLDTNQAKADLGAGKSSLMFSKNIEGVVREQEIINNLGLQPGSNHNSLLEIQFSKKKRAEYESILMKNRPDLPNIPEQVENLFKWANNLNIPENKKPKYKKLALYYTVNGYTRFPEDGYKIEEVIRLSDKNKIDPYAYANPDELINKFTEEVRTSKVNPDNMPELTNKQEFGDGVTVYDVVDSRKGQRAVRSIVDSNWGENANPWCLIARTKEKLIASFKTESEAKVFAENNKNKLSDLSIKFEPNARKWTVIKPVDPKNIMNLAWTHWQQYNRNATGYGYKIAFQKGKLLSLRDGGEGDPDMDELEVYDNETEVLWWDRFDKPSDNLTVDLGKDKDTGYKIIGSIDYEGYFDITGYGEGDFMSKTSDFKLYDADKSLIEQKDFKDGNVSFWLKNEPTKMNDGGRAVTKIESKYTDGVFDSSISTVKDLRTGNIVTKSTISHTTLSKDSYIKEEVVVGKNGRSPKAPKVTTKTIKLINSSGKTTTNIDIYYDQRITEGVSVVNTDRMAELESIKKPFIRFSKSVNKAAKSNNNMLPKSQRLTGDFTNQDVLDRMGELDNEINEAEIQFSKNAAPKLDKEFNDIINNRTGIDPDKTSASIKALKKSTIYKKFEKALEGKKLYHGGSNIIKSPDIKSEDHLTWFYVDVAESAIVWAEGQSSARNESNKKQSLYEVDFNDIAKDHVVFPDFELIPYNIIKKAIDKVYPKGDYLPRSNDDIGPYGAIDIMKDPKAGEIIKEFLIWSLKNNSEYEYNTGDALIRKGKVSEGQAVIVLGEISKDKSKKISFSKKADADPKMNKEFNDIIENKTGIASDKTIESVKASLMGKKKGRFNFFIPPSAEDFMGLLYATLGKGTLGNSQLKWYKDNLIDPYNKAVANITRDRNNLGRNLLALKNELKIIPKDLKKNIKDSVYTKEQAIRVYIWEQIGEKIPGISKTDAAELVELVDSDPKLKLFAQEVMKLNKGRAYIKPSENWNIGTITTDLLEALSTTGRKEYLGLWQQNVDVIFSDKNLNKLEAAFGKSYTEAIKNSLQRMKSGMNRTGGMTDPVTGRVVDWINASTAGIMFFNNRSATLQLISAVNFIDFGDNNIIAAGKAFANQDQYWKDFKTLWNSDFLIERRDGLRININEADIADVAKEGGVKGVINKLLKIGFLPTQVADSFAIASGGSTFYRNRINALIKGGMNPIAANKQAMLDFRAIAQKSQQSSDPSLVSQQQAGPIGRIILAFANTPAQYAREIKKAASDLKNGRGDAKTNISKILYYGVAQNLLFNALQQAMFAMMFEDDEEDDSILAKKGPKVINGMIDGIARGTGLGGAVFTVVKNAAIRIYEQLQEKTPDYRGTWKELARISPPISSKIQKFMSAEKTFSWNMDEIKSKGFSLDNPAYLATGNVVSATTNIPLDRAVKKLDNIVAASNADIATYQRIALLMGWNEWELGLTKKKSKTKSKSKVRKTGIKRPTVNSQGKISGY